MPDLSSPVIWLAFGVLFALTGLLNLARGMRPGASRRSVRLALAVSCFAWGASAILFRFVSALAGYAMAALAVAIMLGGAVLSARNGTR